jgi:hypothetical protein
MDLESIIKDSTRKDKLKNSEIMISKEKDLIKK